MKKIYIKHSGLPKIKIFFIFLYAILLANYHVKAQDEHLLGVIKQANGINNLLYFSDAPNALYDHIASQAYSLLSERKEKIARLQSLSDWQNRQKWIHDNLIDILGPFPEKTPLNPRITRVIKKDGYRIEHILYESQTGFYVTSSLFIPDVIKDGSKGPAIIYVSGHSPAGYRSATFQTVYLNLVKKGFIVFAIDPIGQGERRQYYDPETNRHLVGGATNEHSTVGTQAFISGSSLARYMTWDGIRGVDYLLTRKEVDPARIGITGNSGGGTQTAYIAALDERIYAAANAHYTTNLTWLFKAIGPQDAEQNLAGSIARGLDHGDFLLVRAPKPALMICNTRDIFPIQGSRETAREVSGLYEAYGKKENFGIDEDDERHTYSKKNREAINAFFQKHLNNPGDPQDQEIDTLSNDDLQVTSTGQVSTSFGGETVFSLNRRDAEKLIHKLDASRKDLSSHLPEVIKSAKKLSGYHEPSIIDEPSFMGRIIRKGYVIEKYFVKGEGDYVIPYLLMIPDNPGNKALIYLHSSGKAAEASVGGEIEWFVRNGVTVLAPDLIGVGEMGPDNFNGDKYIGGRIHHDIFQRWFASIQIGRSIAGIRAGDVVRLTRHIKKFARASEIYGIAREEMAPVLLHAAAFEPAISRIALIEPYSSYRSVVMNRFYKYDFINSTVASSIGAYDLPDLAATLVPRKLLIAGITDGQGNTGDSASISADLAIIKAAYNFRNAGKELNIIPGKYDKPYDHFLEWIK